ncbi:MAG TPA: RIP metalloprotease RseP [Blastocatellia bacterium]|nr:RIP metalloprotease RseP [Blastocatellia bacterium]
MEILIKSAVVFALVLGGMIVIHEFGHFIVAKLFGIRVDVFSVGFGRRLFGLKRGDTDYRVSLIPLGGYVKMAGESLDEQRTGAEYEFMSKPKWQRFCVAIAGPVMNILTAFAIPAIISSIHYEIPVFKTQAAIVNAVQAGSPAEAAGIQRSDVILSVDNRETPTWRDVDDSIAINPDRDLPITVRRGHELKELTIHVGTMVVGPEKIGEAGLEAFYGPRSKIIVVQVASGSPAEQAGLKPRDQIVKVNGKPLVPGDNPSEPRADQAEVLHGQFDVTRVIQSSEGQPVTITVKRGDEELQIQATPRMEEGRPRIGFYPATTDADIVVTKLGPGAALKQSLSENARAIELTKNVLGQVFVGKRSFGDTFTGPVGIAQIVGQAAEEGAMPVFQLMGLLSLNLGIFNLLPIPVLDGGLIFMLALEAVLGLFGLPLSVRVRERMMQVGMVMLMLLMGFVIFNDISKRFVSRTAPPATTEQPRK